KNTAETALVVDLWAFADYFRDLTEPANNNFGTAPVLDTPDAGAIETVGDYDLWSIATNGTVIFNTYSSQALELEAVVVNSQGTEISGPYFSGETFDARSGEFLKIYSREAQKAAVSATSVYNLAFDPWTTFQGGG